MFGLGGDPYQGQQAPWSAGPGPLGDLQYQVAGVLNGADQNHVYVPTGPGNPIITLPRPQFPAAYRVASPVSPGGSRGGAAVAILLLAALIAVIVLAQA
jgi:hypothetical protein